MKVELLTRDDLAKHQEELLQKIKALLEHQGYQPPRKLLTSVQVGRMLNVSRSSLQHLRLSGKLPFSKVGGKIFYFQSDVEKMLEEHRIEAEKDHWEN